MMLHNIKVLLSQGFWLAVIAVTGYYLSKAAIASYRKIVEN